MTSSPADSPVNPSVSPGTGKPKTTRGGSGPSSTESFAWYDPDTSSWKTSQGSLLPEWETFSETWPRAGMTVSGKAFRLRLLAPRTYGGGSSSSHILQGLSRAVRLWPTPRASKIMNRRISIDRRPSMLDRESMPTLEDFMGEADPTTIGGRLNPTWVEWLMGFPEGWTGLEDSVTPLFLKSPS